MYNLYNILYYSVSYYGTSKVNKKKNIELFKLLLLEY